MSKQQSLSTTGDSPSTSPESSPPDQSSPDSDDDDFKYRCPYCGVTYDHEILTRVHVSRSEDSDHRNYNGFMPETEIEVINKNNTIIDTISRRPAEIDMSDLSLSVFPDSLSKQHRHILLVASLNKDDQKYTALEDKIRTRLENHNLDCPSYSTIRRVIRRFFRPQITNKETKHEMGSEPESLSSLTEKQQAIIIARLASPDASTKEIADQIGCAKSYPCQIYDRVPSMISDFEAKIEQGDDVETVIRNELTDDEIHDLIEQDLLANVPVNFRDVVDDNSDRETSDSDWGSPTKQHEVMSANPHTHGTKQDNTDDPDVTSQTELSESGSDELDTTNSSVTSNTALADSRPTIPREDIEHLREKIVFTRQILEGSHSDGEFVSLAKHIEDSLETILQETEA